MHMLKCNLKNQTIKLKKPHTQMLMLLNVLNVQAPRKQGGVPQHKLKVHPSLWDSHHNMSPQQRATALPNCFAACRIVTYSQPTILARILLVLSVENF